jgi:hypothetical protein
MATAGTPPLREFLYVALPKEGRIVRIPVLTDDTANPSGDTPVGQCAPSSQSPAESCVHRPGAGTPEIFFQQKGNELDGATSIAFDGGPDGGTLFVVSPTRQRLIAISAAPNPQSRILLERGPLRMPASIVLSGNQLYVTIVGSFCGQFGSFRAPTATAPGSLTLDNQVFVVNAGTTVSNQDLLVAGNQVCLSTVVLPGALTTADLKSLQPAVERITDIPLPYIFPSTTFSPS